MRTTVRLPDPLLDRARREAARRGTTLTALIAEGLQIVLAAPTGSRRRKGSGVPVSRKRGGLLPGVDYRKTSSILDYLDEFDRKEAAARAGKVAERP
jgi:hypothetical protein